MNQVNPIGPPPPGQRVLTAAQRGHPGAIAALINQAMPWPGVTSRVQWQAHTLVITLHGAELPPPDAIVPFMHSGLRRLAAPRIQQVHLQGQTPTSTWHQDLRLCPAPTSPPPVSIPPVAVAANPSPAPSGTDRSTDRPDRPGRFWRSLRPRTGITLGTVGAIALLGYGWQFRSRGYPAPTDWQPVAFLASREGVTVDPLAIAQVLPPPSEPSELVIVETAPPSIPATDPAPVLEDVPVPVISDIEPPPLPEVPPETPEPSEPSEPPELPPSDPWQQAIRNALQAADLNQRAKFRHEWEAVATHWQTAIAFLRSVPLDHTNYDLAQQKILEYSRNLAYASGNVDRAIAITLGHPEAAITVKAVGDMVPGVDFPHRRLPPNGGRNLFDAVRPALDHADLVLGNFESTLTTHPHPAKDVRRPNVYAFRTPPAFAEILRLAGFEGLSVANNHSMDFGLTGFLDTIRHIEAAGMKAIGKKDQIVYLDRKGVTIALIGFSYLDFHNSVHQLEAAKQLVRKANEKATIVIISVHMGAEGTSAMHVRNQQETFFGELRGNPVLFSRTMIDAGADLILGHGPHVPRAIELYGNKLIAYSLGNFVGYGGLSSAAETGYSLILEVQMNRLGNFIAGQIIPVHIDGEGIPNLDRQFRTVKLVDRLNRSDFPQTPLTISPQGAINRQS